MGSPRPYLPRRSASDLPKSVSWAASSSSRSDDYCRNDSRETGVIAHMDFARQQRDPTRHLVGITAVVLVHALVVYALVTGLGKKAIEVIKKPLTATIVEEIKAPPPPPPPPPKKIEIPKIPPPDIPYVPPPDIPAPTITTDPVITAVAPTPPPAPPVIAPPPPAPPKPVVIRNPTILNACAPQMPGE